MHRRQLLRAAAGLTATGLMPQVFAQPAQPAPVFTITVKNMHCAHCAQKIARRLYTVPGVLRVTTNVAANTAVVIPQASRHPSPKSLWEAVEKAGFPVARLQGPQGIFQQKPTV